MKEFMLQFKEGQEYLITARKLRWRYEHGKTTKYYKQVDRELTVRQFEIIYKNSANGRYYFYYNDALIHDFTIDTHSDRYLVILKINQGFPGYEPGHTALSKTPYDAKATAFERRGLGFDNGKAFTLPEPDLTKLSDKGIKDKIMAMIDEPLYVETKRGRGYNPKLFDYIPNATMLWHALNRILRLEEKVATLETHLQPDQHGRDNQPGSDTIQPLYQSLGLLCNPVCNSIARACEHKDGNLCPELSEILMKPGTMIVCHLIKPNIGQADRDKDPLTPESSSEDKPRTPEQEETE